MARQCTICTSEHRDSIDAGIVCGESSYSLADRFNVNPSAVQRHAKRHLSAALAGMRTQEALDRRATLLEQIEVLIRRAEDLFTVAASEGKFNQSLDVLKELRLQLELLGKATGELSTAPTVTINLMQTAEWLELRTVVFAALMAYPDARAAVSGRLLELEAGPRP